MIRKYFLLILLSFFVSGSAIAYPESWEEFNPDDLDGARDATMGNTQQLLEERGSVECIACHGEVDDEYAGVMDSLEISEATLDAALSCLDWEVRGICVWMTCILAA